jgi:excisionase family DNA binding protein
LSETEVATGLSRATLYRLIERGELRTVKRGARRLVSTAELQRLSGAESLALTA